MEEAYIGLSHNINTLITYYKITYKFKIHLPLLLLIILYHILSLLQTLETAGCHCCMGYAFFRKVECLCMQGLQISE